MSGEAQSFSPTALQPDRLFPIGLVDVRIVQHNENLNVMIFEAKQCCKHIGFDPIITEFGLSI